MGTANATVLPHWDIDTLTSQADAVVVGTIVARGSALDAVTGNIVTHSRVQVDTYVTGEGPSTLTLRQSGGRVADQVVYVAGQPALRKGATYLLFLRLDGDVAFLVAMERGVCELVADEDSAWTAHGEASVPVASTVGDAPAGPYFAAPTCEGDPLPALLEQIRGATQAP